MVAPESVSFSDEFDGPLDRSAKEEGASTSSDSWNLDLTELSTEELETLVADLFHNLGLLKRFNIKRSAINAFLRAVSAKYRKNAYHNWWHVCDVTHAAYMLLRQTRAGTLLEEQEKLALMLACICHDIDHPGLNNNFLVKSRDPLALRYSNLSVLENHHASMTLRICLAKDTQILSGMSSAEREAVTELVIKAILSTDMARHDKIRAQFSQLVESSKEDFSNQDDRAILLTILIKVSDLSNTAKEWKLARRWSELIAAEFALQGERERLLQLSVSPFMSPTTYNVCKMAHGFITFVALPFFEAVAVALPEVGTILIEQMQHNVRRWDTLVEKGVVYNPPAIPTLGGGVELDHSVPQTMLGTDSPEQFVMRSPSIMREFNTQRLVRSSDSAQSSSSTASEALASGGGGAGGDPWKSYDIEMHFTQSGGCISNSGDQLAQRSYSMGAAVTREEVAIVLDMESEEGFPSRQNSNFDLQTIREQASVEGVDSTRFSRAAETNLSIAGEDVQKELDYQFKRLTRVSKKMSVMDSSIKPDAAGTSPYRSDRADSITDLRAQLGANFEALQRLATGEKMPLLKRIQTTDIAIRLNKELENNAWQTLMLVITVFALFGEDFRLCFMPKDVDVTFIITTAVVFSLFIVELVVTSLVRPGYIGRFFFWLDLLAAISLMPDFITIAFLSYARAGRAARVGTKAGRIVRFIRLVRLFRAARFATHFEKAKQQQEVQAMDQPSALWKRMSERMTMKLIIGVLSMLVILPMLDQDLYSHPGEYFLEELQTSPVHSAHFNSTFDRFVDYAEEHDLSLQYIGCCASTVGDDAGAFLAGSDHPQSACAGEYEHLFGVSVEIEDKFRQEELLILTSSNKFCEAFFSLRGYTQYQALLNIILTLFIVVILAGWSFTFSQDAHRLLVQPIEEMVKIIETLAKGVVLEERSDVGRSSDGENLETDKVLNSLFKIGHLLKVALGEAGLAIISANLGSDASDDFEPMIPGRKMLAAFGFCDIRQFTDTTECLEEGIMVFVNTIASIVHNAVVETEGAPNKNIGDAFLCVWQKSEAELELWETRFSFADRALSAWLQVMDRIERDETLAEYAQNPRLRERLGEEWKVKMGYGLHVGWAIEGAIGSKHKVDPSYLSPHVNMASRLEAATKQYGVPVLLSGDFVDQLKLPTHKKSCRKLDNVKVKGSAVPIMLYTCDTVTSMGGLSIDFKSYKQTFEEGVDAYIEGNWVVAVTKLKKCQEVWSTDQPATVLLAFMMGHNGIAPIEWEGCRELTEK